MTTTRSTRTSWKTFFLTSSSRAICWRQCGPTRSCTSPLSQNCTFQRAPNFSASLLWDGAPFATQNNSTPRRRRFLAGCAHDLKDFSPFSMARVVDIFEAAVRRGASNGQAVLDLLDRGESVFAVLEGEQPAFATYRRERCERTTVSANGKVKEYTLPTIRAALAKPEDATGRATTWRTTSTAA